MSVEASAISALTAVVSALCFLFKLLWQRSQECERWRADKEPLIEEMAQQLGLHSGITRMVNTCNVDGCPYKGRLSLETFSLKPNPKP